MSNPIFKEERFSPDETLLTGEPMTIQGTVNKVLLLCLCLALGAGMSLYYLYFVNPAVVPPMIIGCSIIAFILVLVSSFNIKLAKYTAAPYALLEGIALGGISAFFEAQYKGIAVQAIVATVAVLFVMLSLYKARIIKWSEKLQAVITTALLSILAIYIIEIVASFFSRGIPLIFDSGIVGIVFSVVVIAFAALSFVTDFYFIEEASRNMLSKDYEWYGALGIMVTVVWLYMEILRLLAKINRR